MDSSSVRMPSSIQAVPPEGASSPSQYGSSMRAPSPKFTGDLGHVVEGDVNSPLRSSRYSLHHRNDCSLDVQHQAIALVIKALPVISKTHHRELSKATKTIVDPQYLAKIIPYQMAVAMDYLNEAKHTYDDWHLRAAFEWQANRSGEVCNGIAPLAQEKDLDSATGYLTSVDYLSVFYAINDKLSRHMSGYSYGKGFPSYRHSKNSRRNGSSRSSRSRVADSFINCLRTGGQEFARDWNEVTDISLKKTQEALEDLRGDKFLKDLFNGSEPKDSMLKDALARGDVLGPSEALLPYGATRTNRSELVGSMKEWLRTNGATFVGLWRQAEDLSDDEDSTQRAKQDLTSEFETLIKTLESAKAQNKVEQDQDPSRPVEAKQS